jgi:hypothetical protein
MTRTILVTITGTEQDIERITAQLERLTTQQQNSGRVTIERAGPRPVPSVTGNLRDGLVIEVPLDPTNGGA